MAFTVYLNSYEENYQGPIIFDIKENRIKFGDFFNLKAQAKEYPSFFEKLKGSKKKEIEANLSKWWTEYFQYKNKTK